MIATIKLTQDCRCTPGMPCCIVFLLRLLFCCRPLSSPASFFSLAFFFLPFYWTEQIERSPGNSFTSRSRGDRPSARARDGYLRRTDQTDRTDVIEPRYFIARAFELRVLAPLTRTNLLRASPRTSCARRLENYMPRDVWILRSAQFLADCK